MLSCSQLYRIIQQSYIVELITTEQRMFNPKAALERIRKNKNQKEEANSLTQGVQPLFPPPEVSRVSPPNQSIEDRLHKLELLVANLTDELANSNQTVSKLKRENSTLETQILKLEYENSQLKSSQVYSEIRRNNSNQKLGLNQSIREEPEKQNTHKKMSSLHENRSMAISQPKQPEYFSPEVEKIIENIKQTPIDSLLRRKEYEYKARKPRQKNLGEGNKYLRDLAEIQKNYKKNMQKPVLIIKLDEADFE